MMSVMAVRATQQLRWNPKIILFIIGERITLKCSRSFIASRSALKIIISVRQTPSTKHIITKSRKMVVPIVFVVFDNII